ncbi:ROK family transcriptional regulator [Herbidospora mongoliensis]|uniref:ROK family transcriptional regulator n=1 Tax=Herbidospora mongoliensis TaxID=688067 RepID=UPI000832C32A|nr:ROK family transcriptional regulator [Herbidospora mongoliensis]
MTTGRATLRRDNLSRVLRHLRDHGTCSRADVVEATGLHRATVSSLMTELMSLGLVREEGTSTAGAIGRPRRDVALDGSHVGALGLEINVDYVAAHGCDLGGRVLFSARSGFDAAGAGFSGCLSELVRMARLASAEMGPLAGVVVAVPGLVSEGAVTFAPNLGWRDVRLADLLRAELGVTVGVGNDANLAALAEYTSGVAAGTSDMVYLTGEAGGGIIVDGRLLRGADGFSGETGHLPVDPGGARCGCGRTGCWETKVGLAALDPAGATAMGPEARVNQIASAAAAGDTRTLDALAEVGRWLGLGGSILVNLFNPRAIVVGGYFAQLASRLIPPAQAELERRAVAGGRCTIVASELGFEAASRGAAGMVVDQILDDPLILIPAG